MTQNNMRIKGTILDSNKIVRFNYIKYNYFQKS